MNSNSNPIRIRIQRVTGAGVPIESTSNSKSDISSSSGSSTVNEDNGDNPCIMGEKLFFSVIIENNTNSSITVTSIEAFNISERTRTPLVEITNPQTGSSLSTKQFQISHNSSCSLLYSSLLCELGHQTIRIVLHYMNVVSAFTLADEYSFLCVKPFSLAFIRYQLNDTSYLINSIIINNLSKPMTITHIRIDNLISSLQETYNSFSESVIIPPGKQYNHSCILSGSLESKLPIGCISIHFTTPGHDVIHLNSTTITIESIRTPSFSGYYEMDGELSRMQSSQVTAVITNYTDTTQFILLDWSQLQSGIQVIGECSFTRRIKSQETIRLPLTILPVLSGMQKLESPTIHGKGGIEKNTHFPSISVFVQ